MAMTSQLNNDANAPAFETESTDVKTMLGMSVFYVVFGFLLGMLFGALMKLFHTETCEKYFGDKEGQCQKYLKFVVTLTIAITTPIWCWAAGFRES